MCRRRLLIGAGVLAAICLSGCEQPLFPRNAPRSPYDRYQTLRGQDRPMTEKNVWGGEQPALRNRLKPLGEP